MNKKLKKINKRKQFADHPGLGPVSAGRSSCVTVTPLACHYQFQDPFFRLPHCLVSPLDSHHIVVK
jgi:hypothetical protein